MKRGDHVEIKRLGGGDHWNPAVVDRVFHFSVDVVVYDKPDDKLPIGWWNVPRGHVRIPVGGEV